MIARTVLLCVLAGWLVTSVLAADHPTLAITPTWSEKNNANERSLISALSSFVELQLLEDKTFSLVERTKLDAVLLEQGLSRSRSNDNALQLGQLITTDFLVVIEAQPPSPTSSKLTARLRVVEAKTAAIRGVDVVSDLDLGTAEEAAQHMAQQVRELVKAPQQRRVTVAVAPFESVGRLDRLRPLERGLRDLATARFLKLSRDQQPASPIKLHVLQRTNLEQLLRELDLIQSGFADPSTLPASMPDRAAAFLLKGEIDEVQDDRGFRVIVNAQLIHAARQQAVGAFRFECPPQDIESRLTVAVDGLVRRMVGPDSVTLPNPGVVTQTERATLKKLAIQDLHRFCHISPIDFAPRPFAMPGESERNLRLIEPNTLLARALLSKSIDRLESALFIQPDDVEAMYALGWCFSFREPGVYRLDRAAELFRKVVDLRPNTELAALALALLPELGFVGGQFQPQFTGDRWDESQSQAAKSAARARVLFAFEHMPERFRDPRWARLVELLGRIEQSAVENAKLVPQLMTYAEESVLHRRLVRRTVTNFIKSVALSSLLNAERAQVMANMEQWQSKSDPELVGLACEVMAAMKSAQGERLAAAELFEKAARSLKESMPNLASEERHMHDNYLLQAAQHYRLGRDLDRASAVLKTFYPPAAEYSLLPGKYHDELGQLHAARGNKTEAVQEYWKAATVCPLIVSNSNLAQRLQALGGAPLNEDRDVEVRYVLPGDDRIGNKNSSTQHRPSGERPARRLLVHNDQLILTGSEVVLFNPMTEVRRVLRPTPVTSVLLHDNQLWIGTHQGELHRYGFETDRWQLVGSDFDGTGQPNVATTTGLSATDRPSADGSKRSDEKSIPQPVTSLARHGNETYLSIGTRSSGGLMRIDAEQRVHLCQEPNAPRTRPTQLLATDMELIAACQGLIHRWSWEEKRWAIDPPFKGDFSATLSVFSGPSGLWASVLGRELFLWNANDATNQTFQPAWHQKPQTRAGYPVSFVVEHADDIWFGGESIEPLVSSGLYRFNRKTQTFKRYTPTDGFASVPLHNVYDAVWLNGRLWLATSHGLCCVTPR